MTEAPFSPQPGYLDWRTFKGNGVNLGSWFCLETFMVPAFFARHAGAIDEWTVCQNLGSGVGPILEDHYNTFFTTDHIDTFAAQALICFAFQPLKILKKIATYAIEKYNMHVVIDLHSLPGGVNFLEIGEANGHGDWLWNEANLELSYQAVEAVIEFVQTSGHAGSYTIAPINEVVDSDDLRTFGTDAALSLKAADWLLQYIRGALERISAANPNIPLMFQDSFRGEAFWAFKLPPSANLVIDTHFYYFAGRGCDSDTVVPVIISDAKRAPGSGTFPVIVGEWSIETEFNNNLARRKELFDVGRWAFNKYVQGSMYWSGRVESDARVSGEGTKSDYWSYLCLIKEGVVQPANPDAEYH